MTKFFFRLNRVKIASNGDGKFLGLIGSDKSKIQFISLVVEDSTTLPNLEKIVTENDQAKREELIKETAKAMATSFVFTPIHDIKDNFEVTFGDTGVVLHMSSAIPRSFHWEFLCVKLNKGQRDLAKEIQGVVENQKFDEIAGKIPVLVGAAASAPYTAGIAIGKFVAGAFLNHLKEKKDKQLGILETSFIRPLDYPNGNREGRDVRDSQNNLRIDYSIFGFES